MSCIDQWFVHKIRWSTPLNINRTSRALRFHLPSSLKTALCIRRRTSTRLAIDKRCPLCKERYGMSIGNMPIRGKCVLEVVQAHTRVRFCESSSCPPLPIPQVLVWNGGSLQTIIYRVCGRTLSTDTCKCFLLGKAKEPHPMMQTKRNTKLTHSPRLPSDGYHYYRLVLHGWRARPRASQARGHPPIFSATKL